MNNKLQYKFTKLEASRLALIERLEHIPTNKLETPPAPGKWSVAQVFYHLNKAESYSTIYVSKKRLDVNDLKKTGLKEAYRMLQLRIRFASSKGLKAPAVLGEMPEYVSYNAILIEWEQTRKNLQELLISLPDDILNKNVFKQPVLGRLNIFQMLDFMQAHFNRHKKQVERIVMN